MADDPKDGGTAFPGYVDGLFQHGMSLRDWYAGQALAGFTTNAEVMVHAIAARAPGLEGPDIVAGMAYEIADAMLAAREKR